MNQYKDALNEYRHLVCRAIFDINLIDDISYADLYNGNYPAATGDKLGKTGAEISQYIKAKYGLADEDIMRLVQQITEEAVCKFVVEHAFTPTPKELSAKERLKLQQDIESLLDTPAKLDPNAQ